MNQLKEKRLSKKGVNPPKSEIYKNIEIRNFKKHYNMGIFRSNWISHNDDYIKINETQNKENKKLKEIKNENII